MEPHRQQVGANSIYFVEGYWPGIRVQTFSDAARRLVASVADLRREGFSIRQVVATLIPGDEAAIWIIDGPSVEIVALAYERAGVSIDRIVRATDLQADLQWSRRPDADYEP